MHIQGFRPHFSRSIMIQWFIFLIISTLLFFFFNADLEKMYLSNSQTNTGLFLNGLILVLFGLGMVRFISVLLRYQGEEKALKQFAKNIHDADDNLLNHVAPNSIIAQRFETLQGMATSQVEINHSALASTLIASESTHTGLLRFVQNTLILCGVFGTIVSLSIALFGASSLLESSVSSSGMGMVIHGMSTALSTTMTAILCYLSFAYFNGALQHVQTNFLSAVEHLTTTRLIPSLQITPNSIDRQLASLLRAMALLVQEMQQNEQAIPELLQKINELSQTQTKQHEQSFDNMTQIQDILRQGFRLPQA
ncbi:MAG: hypothetical protein Q9M15_06245 [Mariprofundaceae bacterium]|nr:hypothetical protein [Mariprofundaceae bacterium]